MKMAEDKRLASDILLNIENLLKKHEFNIRNIDNNIKILMNKLNSIEESLRNSSIENNNVNDAASNNISNAEEYTVQAPKVVMTPHGPIKPTPVKIKQQEETETITDNSVKDKLVTVSQKLIYPNGDKIAYANIEISSEDDNNVISTCKTNTEGKWVRQLAPGKYNIHLVKKSTNNKSQSIDARYSITIPSSVQSIDLPSPTFK